MNTPANTTCSLTGKRCVPCEGGIPPLAESRIAELLTELKDWSVREGKYLEKQYVLKNFATVMQLVNRIAELAESEGHHPDLYIHDWKNLDITLTTHAIGGLSENDFILAAKIDAVVAGLLS